MNDASFNAKYKSCCMLPIVCSTIFMQHIWPIFNKNTHKHERSAIEIDEMENFQDIFMDILSFFTQKNSRIYYRDL